MDGTLPLADQIRVERERRGLSVRKAAAQVGVKRHTWAAWERGTRPQRRHHKAIEETLGWRKGAVASILAGPPADDDPHYDRERGERYVGVEALLWDLRLPLAQQFMATMPEGVALARGEALARMHIDVHRSTSGMPPAPRRVATPQRVI